MSATQSSFTYTVGDLVSGTLINSRQEVVDNIFKKSAYLAKMMLNGRKRIDEGGIKINRSVEYGTNGTVTSFNGYDVVPIVPQESVTDTQWDWKEYAGNWVISRREERLNTGKSKIRDLAAQKKSNLERSFSETLNGALLQPSSYDTVGNGGKDLTPLSMLVSNKATLTVGTIAESTNSFWANQRKIAGSVNATAQNGSKFIQEVRSFYNTCSQHNDGPPNFGLWDKQMFETYEAVLDTKIRYGSTEMANIGFTTAMLYNMELTWDQKVPGFAVNAGASSNFVDYNDATLAERCGWFLNTDFLYLIVDSGTDFVFTKPVNHEPGGQYATSGSLLFMGEHICTNRRAQGIYYGFTPAQIALTA